MRPGHVGIPEASPVPLPYSPDLSHEYQGLSSGGIVPIKDHVEFTRHQLKLRGRTYSAKSKEGHYLNSLFTMAHYSNDGKQET